MKLKFNKLDTWVGKCNGKSFTIIRENFRFHAWICGAQYETLIKNEVSFPVILNKVKRIATKI